MYRAGLRRAKASHSRSAWWPWVMMHTKSCPVSGASGAPAGYSRTSAAAGKRDLSANSGRSSSTTQRNSAAASTGTSACATCPPPKIYTVPAGHRGSANTPSRLGQAGVSCTAMPPASSSTSQPGRLSVTACKAVARAGRCASPSGRNSSSTLPPHTMPASPPSRRFSVFRSGFPAASTSRAAAMARPSTAPPPTVPHSRPSGPTAITAPGPRGTEP